MLREADHPPHPPGPLLNVAFGEKAPRARAKFHRGFIGSNFGIASFLENVIKKIIWKDRKVFIAS